MMREPFWSPIGDFIFGVVWVIIIVSALGWLFG
jgi:hypothetical protein